MFLRKRRFDAIVKNVCFTDHDHVKIILNDSEVDFDFFPSSKILKVILLMTCFIFYETIFNCEVFCICYK